MNESRFGLNYDDPKFLRRVVDVGNCRAEADSPDKMLLFAMIEEAFLTATAQKSDWKKPCREQGCNGRRSNKACALAYFQSKEFDDVAELLGINPSYYRKLMSEWKQPKRQYRKGAARKAVVLEATQTQGDVEDRRDSRLPGEAGGAPRPPEVGGPLLRGEEAGCDSVPGGLCGYAEPERVGSGEAGV